MPSKAEREDGRQLEGRDHVIVPAIRGGATVMDSVFGDLDHHHDPDHGSGHGMNAETA
jgi:hypothetical protein